MNYKNQILFGSIAFVLVLIFLFFSFALISKALENNLSPSLIIYQTNKDRLDAGLQALATSTKLQKAAQMKADDIAQREYFSHVSPDGLVPWSWLKKINYNYKSAGENLAINFFDYEDLEKAWLNSPKHKANILSEKYSEIGVGIAQGFYQGKKTIYIVEFFGTQK